MQRSPLLKTSGILTAVGSCLALLATLFMAWFTQREYFTAYHYGTRVIDAPFYLRISIIVFVLFAVVFGIISAKQTFRRKSYWFSILGATFLLIAGLLFLLICLSTFCPSKHILLI